MQGCLRGLQGAVFTWWAEFSEKGKLQRAMDGAMARAGKREETLIGYILVVRGRVELARGLQTWASCVGRRRLLMVRSRLCAHRRQKQELSGGFQSWASLGGRFIYNRHGSNTSISSSRGWGLLGLTLRAKFGATSRNVSSQREAVEAWQRCVVRRRVVRALVERLQETLRRRGCASIWQGWILICWHVARQRKGVRRLVSDSFFKRARQTVESWRGVTVEGKRLRLAISRMTSRTVSNRCCAAVSWGFTIIKTHATEEIRLRAASRRVVLQRLLRLAAAVLVGWHDHLAQESSFRARSNAADRWRRRREAEAVAQCLFQWQTRLSKRRAVMAALRRRRVRDEGWLLAVCKAWWQEKNQGKALGRASRVLSRSRRRWSRFEDQLLAWLGWVEVVDEEKGKRLVALEQAQAAEQVTATTPEEEEDEEEDEVRWRMEEDDCVRALAEARQGASERGVEWSDDDACMAAERALFAYQVFSFFLFFLPPPLPTPCCLFCSSPSIPSILNTTLVLFLHFFFALPLLLLLS